MFAQNPDAGAPVRLTPQPDWVEPSEPVLQSESAESRADGGVAYLLYDRQVNALPDRDATYSHYIRKYLTEAGVQERSQVEITFDPAYQELHVHLLRIHRDGEILDRLDGESFRVVSVESGRERQLFDGSLSAVAVVEDVRVGDALEYAFTLTGANPVFAGRFYDSFATEWAVPVGHFRSRLIGINPEAVGIVAHKTALEPKATPLADGTTALTWTASDIPAIQEDDQVPGEVDTHGWIEISGFTDWNDVARWAAAQYHDDAPPPAEIRETADRIRSEHATDAERAAAALRHVQDSFRYVGMFNGVHSHRPHDLETIVKRRFGDCKDKSRLLVALLAELGLDARPALVDVNAGEGIGRLAPSPFAFDHAVVHLRLDGREYWLDPTRSFQRGTLDRIYFPEYGQGLVVGDATEGLSPVTPQSKDESWIDVRETYTVADFLGTAELAVETVYSGRHADSLRDYFQSSSRQAIEKDYREYYAEDFPIVEIGGDIETEDDETNNRFTVRERYHLGDIWTASTTDEGYIECGFHARSIVEELSTPSDRLREMPFLVDHPVSVRHRITLNLPRDLGFDDESAAVQRDPLDYQYSAQPQGRRIVLDHALKSTRRTVPPEAMGAYLDDVDRIQDHVAYWVLVPESWGEADGLADGTDRPAATRPGLRSVAGVLSVAAFSVGLVSALLLAFVLPGGTPPGPGDVRPGVTGFVALAVVATALLLPAAALIDVGLAPPPAPEPAAGATPDAGGPAAERWFPALVLLLRAGTLGFLAPLSFLGLGAFFARSPAFHALQSWIWSLVGLSAASVVLAPLVFGESWRGHPAAAACAVAVLALMVPAQVVLARSAGVRRWFARP